MTTWDKATQGGAPEPGLSTRCVHAGEELDAQGAIHTALYHHCTFGFSSTADPIADPTQALNGVEQ
ncbi:MAG: hypothetical protein WKF95_17360 [Rubrobacter sp.]